jgi:hypothetical protein
VFKIVRRALLLRVEKIPPLSPLPPPEPILFSKLAENQWRYSLMWYVISPPKNYYLHSIFTISNAYLPLVEILLTIVEI